MSNKAMDPEQLLNALDRYITAQVSLMLSPADKENRVVWARRAGEVERARECLRGELDKLRPDGVSVPDDRTVGDQPLMDTEGGK